MCFGESNRKFHLIFQLFQISLPECFPTSAVNIQNIIVNEPKDRPLDESIIVIKILWTKMNNLTERNFQTQI